MSMQFTFELKYFKFKFNGYYNIVIKNILFNIKIQLILL